MKVREAQIFSDNVVAIIKQEQIKKGISNYALAELSGLSEASLSYIFHNQRRPTLYTLMMITEALGLSLSEIIANAERNAHLHKEKARHY